jgi:hypothetical protein
MLYCTPLKNLSSGKKTSRIFMASLSIHQNLLEQHPKVAAAAVMDVT